jgi:hypothetical protein
MDFSQPEKSTFYDLAVRPPVAVARFPIAPSGMTALGQTPTCSGLSCNTYFGFS